TNRRALSGWHVTLGPASGRRRTPSPDRESPDPPPYSGPARRWGAPTAPAHAPLSGNASSCAGRARSRAYTPSKPPAVLTTADGPSRLVPFLQWPAAGEL